MIKIKDLSDDTDLGKVRFKDPKTGEVWYWFSQWNKGIWCKKDPSESRLYPLLLNDLQEALEFEVVE